MYKLFFTIIQLLLHIDYTTESNARQSILAAKGVGKILKSPLNLKITNTIKKPILKTLGNTIKSTVGMFKRQKNVIKTLSYGIHSKHLKTGIETIKVAEPQLHKGGKTGIQKKSINYLKSPNLKFFFNAATKSKPQLPFILALGGFDRIAKMNLIPEGENPNDLDNTLGPYCNIFLY